MTDHKDPATEAALRILEAQFDVLDQNALALDEDQTSRLLAAAEHLFLITRLALIKNRLERDGIWRKHALPSLDDPDGIYFVGSDGVKYTVFVDEKPHPLITELLETSSTRYFEGTTGGQEDFFENLMPVNSDPNTADPYGTTEAAPFMMTGMMHNAAIDHVPPAYEPPPVEPAPAESIWAMEGSVQKGVSEIVESFKDGIFPVGGSSQGASPYSELMLQTGSVELPLFSGGIPIRMPNDWPNRSVPTPLSEPFPFGGSAEGFDTKRLDG